MTESVLLAQVQSFDDVLFRRVFEWESPSLDRVMPVLSEAASYSRLWMALALAIAAIGGSEGMRAAITGVVAIGITSGLANIVGKGLTRRARPSGPVPEARRLIHPDSSSFPSGHAASAEAFSGVIGAEIPRLWMPLNALAAAVGFSRVYTGVHYPGDVAAGWLLGKVVAAVVHWVAQRIVR